MDICAVVLAAGEGKRMKSKKSKLVHRLAGRPIVGWVHEALNSVGAADQVYIVGHLQEQVRAALGEGVAFVIQERQLGTGHAVMQAAPFLESRGGCTLVLVGDAPLISPETLRDALAMYESDGYAAVVITADAEDPTGLGRIVRDTEGNLRAIVEHRDATPAQRRIREINSGMYVFNTPLLLSALGRIGSQNVQNEYYLTETIGILIGDGHRIGAFKAPFEETLGINDRVQLAQAARIMNRRICERHMRAGVTILDPDAVWIDGMVEIGADTEILSGTRLEGATVIGEDCVIGPASRLIDVTVGDGVFLENTAAAGCRVGEGARVGPYACLRPGTVIGRNSRVGVFVEIDNATIGDRTRAAHLAYIGDADLGTGVTYGCGSITANDDGSLRQRTVVGDNAFIGSNAVLVAPVEIHENAYVAAGSTITDGVPAGALAIARERQTVKRNWNRRVPT